MLKHFVITRIGLATYDEARLNKLIDLFEAVTLSSLKNQSSHDFCSLIVTDFHMPAAPRKKLQALLERHTNFFLVPIDLTGILHVRSGCFDWVWDHCQDFILERGLIDDPHDYCISSTLDADDAWHRDVISTINAFSEECMPAMLAIEKERDNTWTSHSAGIAVTFRQGYWWYVANNTLGDMTHPFHSMSSFVTTRFSSGNSVCSSRHAAWPQYAEVTQIEIATSKLTEPMWVYARHDEATVSWSAEKSRPIDAKLARELGENFGIDMKKVRRWCSAYPTKAQEGFTGQKSTRAQYDLVFRIAALNRKIGALRRTSRSQELVQCENRRENLVKKLQS